MKKMIFAFAFLASLTSISSFAAAEGFRPNQCRDGGVYRALNGPDVTTDANGTKVLRADGHVVIECRVGNTDTCVGTSYNDYTCELNVTETADDAAAIAANVDFGSDGILRLTRENSSDCGQMHCIVEQSLICAHGVCAIKPVVSGWDE